MLGAFGDEMAQAFHQFKPHRIVPENIRAIHGFE
jgi:hypothetical protein